ncbi:MAG: inositol monophosphatase family protein [Patescibacteria group bacterium]
MAETLQQKEPSLVERFKEIGFDDHVMLAAQGAARLGARQILKFHGASQEKLRTELKAGDMTPVTAADIASEEAILKIITTRLYSPDEVHAEEKGRADTAEHSIMWYVDPLDGTRSFTREQTASTVGICMYEHNEPHTAVICRPFQCELLLAGKGRGAFVFPLDDKQKIIGPAKRVHVAERKDLTGGIFYWDGVMTGKNVDRALRMFEGVIADTGKTDFRALGTNIGEQAEVALGHGDLKLTTGVGGFYDIAVGGLIIQEAGGEVIDENGKPISPGSKAALFGNPELIKKYGPLFQQCYAGYDGFA